MGTDKKRKEKKRQRSWAPVTIVVSKENMAETRP